MKISVKAIIPHDLAEFADANGLEIEVRERDGRTMENMKMQPSDRFYARFKGVEVSEGRCLRGTYGNGGTPDAAIHAYCKEIQGLCLVKDAYKDTRKEIQAPSLLVYKPSKRRKVAAK